ncbi:MAG TPA: ABC transporter ATP-binding protein [Sulfuricurvum sp.]|nr:ABC transporter ATP-binding protein [Sulfuricurvum sp.]
MITALSVTKKFGEKIVLNGVSFSIPRGSITGLIGRNGAGKTTLMGILCGLIQADSGSVQVGNIDLFENMTKARALIGYVPQKTSLYLDMTGRENLTYFGLILGLSGQRLKDSIQEVVKATSLDEYLDVRVSNYSGGMQKRLNLAIGLLGNPPILYLDEPTVGVDRESREIILDTLLKMRIEYGTTVLYTSHYLQEIEKICDRLIVLDKGSVAANDTTSHLLREFPSLEDYLEENIQK